MTGGTTTVGIEVRADGTQEAARDLAAVDASLKKIQADLGGTAQPAGVAAQGLEQLGAAGKSAGAGLGAVGASAKKAAEGLGSVSKFASSAKFDKVVSDLGAMGVKLNTSSLHAQKLAKAMQQVERERAFQQLAADANLSTLQLAKFRAELGDTRGALATLSNGLGLSKAAMLAFAAAVAFGGQACLEAALQADRLSKAYTTITGSSSAAQQQLSYLYDVSNRLGLQFQSTAESAKTFFAAGKGSSLEKDMNGIFEAVASAGAALALSQDDMQGAFLALGQMISKGKVQAEELRGQLGERLPGAFQLAAKAMGMTTAQLDKFMADGKLTAEDLLPKLAKVMQEEFGAAAEAAAYGLQGQMNRLSTEWTRLKATILDSDSVASVFGTLAEGMKSLADNGEIVAAVVGKGLQWAAWSAGVYAFIKSISGLVAVFQTLKTLAGAVSFAGIFKAAGPVAAALGLVAVAIGSVTTEQDSGEDIGRRYASVTSDIAAALKKQAQAANDAKASTDQLSESQKKLSASQAIEDQARALQEMQSLATGKGWLEMLGLGGESDEAVEKIREKTVELLTAIRTGQGDVSQLAFEIDKLGTTSDSAARLATSILDWLAKAEKAGKTAGGQFIITTDAARDLTRSMEEAKAVMSSPWTINVDDAIKSIAALEKGIRAFQAERLGMKGSKLSDILSDFSPEVVKRAQDAYSSKGFGMALKALGIEIGSLTVEQEKNLNTAFRLQKQYDAEAKTTEAYRKALREAEKDHTSAYNQMENNAASYKSEVEQTEASIRSLQAQLATAPGDVFSREQAKILADYEKTLEKINEEATKYANKKGVSTEQANQLKKQKEIEAGLKRDLDLRQAQEKEEKRLAELARDKYEFYKELEELTGEYGLSLQFQSEVLAAQVKELERLQIPQEYIEQWKGLKALQSSNDWADGAVRGILKFKAEASDTAGQTESAFTSLFSGIQSASLNMWEDFLETGKLSLSSLKSVFKSFIAQLLQIAVMNPIIVRVATSVQGALWGASAESVLSGSTQSGGISGLIGNIPFSSFLPDSFTSGLSGIMGATLPGTVSALTTPGAYTAGEILLMQGGGTTAGTVGGQAALMSGGLSLGSALMYGGLGSLGYSLLGGALGLPQNKYSGITSGLGAGLGAWGASAALSGTALGATLGSAVPVVGTVIGAALGGLASSLFGGGKKTHPSVYTNVVDASLFGSDWEALMTQGAWTDRASVSDAAGIFKGLGEVANTTASSIMGFAQALPEEYQAQVLARLNAETVSFGRGSTAGRKGVTDYGPSTWNFQFHNEKQLQEVINTAGEDIQRVMLNALQRAMVGTDLSSMLAVDLSSTEGLDKAIQAINAINTVTEATANIKEPLSEMEQQAKAARAQLDEWTESMRSLGVNADYAGKLMEDYRHAYIDNVIESLDESLHPLSAYAQAVKTANEAVDQRKKALEIIGATESQLAQVEAMRAEVVKQATEEMLRSFDQSVAQRWAAVNGNADEVGRAISQANELRETIQQFGEGSAQVAELLKLHAAETAKAAQDAAKSEYDSLKAQMDALEQQRVQLQQQAIQEQINAINEQLSAAKTLKSTWEGLDKSLGQSRYNLFAGSANLDAENRLGTVQAEFRRLSGLALGGDSDAAGQLAGVGTSLLDLVRQTAGTEEEYLDAFWVVNAQLKSAQDAAGAQVSAADKQLEALQGQLDVQNAALKQLQGQSATLEEIEKQIADLKPLLDAAGQKAGVKAFARGGLAMPGWAVVGEEGPELVNFSQPGRVYTAADTAALFRSATPRGTSGESGGSREEVYELRRDMNILLNEVAKYGRRVSDLVELWDKEGMPGVRA
ncbi:tape measure protein [Bilophila wadsworthia]|uniref:tape measure protein n=2 Tax=Bilophila wadsworthia TaxID=35833 RepID=UPI002674579F|nr:tape measure protein [Bilophila wadsworthia]